MWMGPQWLLRYCVRPSHRCHWAGFRRFSTPDTIYTRTFCFVLDIVAQG